MTKNELRVPATGPGVLVLRKWHVANHANVGIGFALCELDSESPDGGAYTDLISDWNGTLHIIVPEGAEVTCQQVVAYIITQDNH